MATKKQLISTIAIGVAFVAIATLIPAAAQAHFGTTRETPEVDPSTIAGALALAMGGLAVLSDKLRRP